MIYSLTSPPCFARTRQSLNSEVRLEVRLRGRDLEAVQLLYQILHLGDSLEENSAEPAMFEAQ